MSTVVSSVWPAPRRFLLRLVLTLSTFQAFSGASRAAPVPPSGAKLIRLSLDEALARAESASVLVRRVHAERISVAARDVGASRVLPTNPLASFAAGPRREQTDASRAEGVQIAAHIEQTFEIAGQRATRRTEVARQVGAASWREAVARVETRARVRAVYVAAQLAHAELQAAGHRLELVQQLVQGVGTRVESGGASAVDLDLARVEHGRAARDRAGAELSLALSLTDLRVLIAAAPEAPLELATPLGTPPARSALIAPLLARALQHRAELNLIAASRDANDAAITRLAREALPNPTLFVDFQRDLPGQVFVGGGIALPLPLWRRNQGELAVAHAERDRLQEEADLTMREIEFEVERAFHATSTYGEMVRLMETEMLPAAESAAALITQGWRAGKFDLFRVIQASREATEARRGYLQALASLWTATISLDRAVGTP
jgi:outer membrane protein, heavy metal efflux system